MFTVQTFAGERVEKSSILPGQVSYEQSQIDRKQIRASPTLTVF